MAEPYDWYQGELDFTWEIDLWGHMSRAVKASEADSDPQKALLEFAPVKHYG